MSLWQIGINEVPEEIQSLKNKLSSKDTQIAAQHSEILKQAADLEELKTTLNETLHKLHEETTRVLSLEFTLAKCQEDLQNEAIASQNTAAALVSVHEKHKAKDLEIRALEVNLEALSHKSDSFNARAAKLEKEKTTLETRVRELESNLRQLSSPAPTATPSRQRTMSRRRSSSVSDTRIITLEQELKETRASLAQKDTELHAAAAKFAQAQTDLIRVENEKLAADRRLQAEIHDLQLTLHEKTADLEYMREQQHDGSREEELLRRIDEDDARIAALEQLLRGTPEPLALKEQMRRLEQKLLFESERVLEMEGRHIELVREKEEALDEVEEVRAQLASVSDALCAKQRLNADQLRPSEEDIERLFGAIERIRGERDNLRRDVEFLQSEARFTEEALRARIAALENTNPSPQLQAEVLRLQRQLAESTAHEQTTVAKKNEEIRRVGRIAMASAVVIEYLRSEMGMTAQRFLNASTASESALDSASRRLKDVELQLCVATQRLDDITPQPDELSTSHMDAQLEAQLADMSRTLDDITAERNALNLQIANLTRDLEAAQGEIAEGERRYTTLQFHQLSAMTMNEAAETLRAQLADQEQRVLRRTELVGILQHDNERLETNMKLQEERLAEMTAELEVLAAQKDAMVEDCADARHARDLAIRRVEELEVEMETLEGRAADADGAVCALVGVVVETVTRSRRKLRHMSESVGTQSVDWAAQLEEKRHEFQEVVSRMEVEHHAETRRLSEQLATKDQMLNDNDLEGEIARLKVEHVEEIGVLQARLVEMASALDEAQTRFVAAEENYRRALSDSTCSKQQLESAVGDAAVQAEELQAEITRIREEHTGIVEQLREQVASATAEAQKSRAVHQELQSLHQRSMGELAEVREASAAQLQELEDHEAELESQLAALNEEADALRDQLQQEAEALVQKKQEFDAALQDALGQRGRAESALGDLKQELLVASDELAQARSEVDSMQKERTALQEEITLLQAEIQRSLSLRRYLESQLKDKEQMVASLTIDLEHVKTQFSCADRARQAAEVDLSLHSAQHRREMSELQKQVAALQAQPDMNEVLADLEERNKETEELLKHKCAELEEYDDRAIEILTNNKKLTTKVESLTRKVQKLQTKLEAMEMSKHSEMPVAASTPRASPPLSGMLPPRQRSNTLSSVASSMSVSSVSSVPPVPPIPSLSSFAPRSPVRAQSNRAVSGSSLPRPKTPERKAIPPVFRAQTPEKRIVPIPPSPSAPLLGMKRRAPDDFEDVHVPTQGFTAESLPERDENGTPRVRRVHNSAHSGFTPVRGRPTPVPSPKRPGVARPAMYIADVTNSPRLADTAKSKRTWLGKIRGTAQQKITPSRTGEL